MDILSFSKEISFEINSLNWFGIFYKSKLRFNSEDGGCFLDWIFRLLFRVPKNVEIYMLNQFLLSFINCSTSGKECKRFPSNLEVQNQSQDHWMKSLYVCNPNEQLLEIIHDDSW